MTFFGLDVGLAQHRREDHVRDDIKRDAPVPRRHARPEDGDLFVGRGVDDAPAALDLHADVGRGRALHRSFEHHVLEEMARPRIAAALHARSGADKDSERRRACLRHLRDEDPHAVREGALQVLHRAER